MDTLEQIKSLGISLGTLGNEDPTFYNIIDGELQENPVGEFDSFSLNFSSTINEAPIEQRIAIKGNAGVLYRVTPNDRFVNDITDSVWYANGNEYPWYDDFYDEINWDEFEEEQTEDVEFFDEMEIEENTSNPIETEDQELPAASADPTEKTYYEFRDSIELMLQLQFLKKVNDELFIEGKSLISEDKRFAARLSNTAEGTFYIDNSRTIRKDYDIRYMRLHYPTLYNDLYEVYKDNLITGELTITDHSIEMHMDANYGEKLGSIY